MGRDFSLLAFVRRLGVQNSCQYPANCIEFYQYHFLPTLGELSVMQPPSTRTSSILLYFSNSKNTLYYTPIYTKLKQNNTYNTYIHTQHRHTMNIRLPAILIVLFYSLLIGTHFTFIILLSYFLSKQVLLYIFCFQDSF